MPIQQSYQNISWNIFHSSWRWNFLLLINYLNRANIVLVNGQNIHSFLVDYNQIIFADNISNFAKFSITVYPFIAEVIKNEKRWTLMQAEFSYTHQIIIYICCETYS